MQTTNDEDIVYIIRRAETRELNQGGMTYKVNCWMHDQDF